MFDWLNKAELEILDGIQDIFGCSFMDAVVPVITFFGNAGWMWIVMGLVFVFIRKYRRTGITLLAGLVVHLLTCNIALKNIICRDRPCWVNDSVELLVSNPTDYSFPSGHTMVSFVAATVLTMLHPKWGFWAYPVAALLGFSRLYLYVHFPTDVLAGAILGVIVGILVTVGMKKLFAYLEKKHGICLQ